MLEDIGNYYYFNIVSFNDKVLVVSVKRWEKNEITEKFEIARASYFQDEDSDMNLEEKKKIMQELHDQIPIENKNKLEKLRQEIVKIWSENQSSIPKFDIKKY